MAWQRPLTPRFMFLLAMWWVAAARGSRLDLCGVHPHLVPATQAPACLAKDHSSYQSSPAPPCATTEDTVNVALPVLLSLNHPSLAGQPGPAWGMHLYLLDDAGTGRAEVEVGWDEGRREVTLRGRTCGGQDRNQLFPSALRHGEHWLHLQVEAAGRQVTLSHLKASGKVPAMTLTFQGDPPTTVAAVPRTRLGYSAAAIVDVTDWYSWCDRHPRPPLPASRAPYCLFPPCAVTMGSTDTLALPFLLSIKDPRQPDCLYLTPMCRTRLSFVDDSGARRGMVWLVWEGQELNLWGRTCCGQDVSETVPIATFLPGAPWQHWLLEAKGRHVTLSLQSVDKYETVLTLTFQDDPPTTVEVQTSMRAGYSAATTSWNWWRGALRAVAFLVVVVGL